MAGRRMSGEGSIYKRASNGRWVATYTDKAGNRRTVTAKTKTEVLKRLADVRRKLDGGLPARDSRVTVSQLLDRWVRDVLPAQVAPSAVENYSIIADTHLRPALGSRRVAELTTDEIDELLAAKRSAGYSVSTVRRIRAVLSQALTQAVKWKMIQQNPAVLSVNARAPRIEGRSLTPEQVRTFLGSVRGDRLEAAYVTLIGTGLRRGELLALAWDVVDLDASTLTVRRALKYEANVAVIGDVKTASSRRAVNLPAPVTDALRAHRTRQAAEKLASSRWEDSGLVFTNRTGGPIDPRNFSRGFAKAAERAGLGHWHVHEARHSAASLMLARGVPLEVVADVLGHSSVRVTADVYGHVMAPQRQDAAAKMAELLG